MAPQLPAGRKIHLPGRGKTFIREMPGPSGAPTVVLLHGWTVNADLNWFTAYGPLARHVNVVAMDHRGHGRGVRSLRRFRLADCADDVAALADVLGLDQVVPVGYSMGGPVSLLTWHRHRDRVAGLVLCATAPYFQVPEGPASRVFGALPMVATATRLTPPPIRRLVADRVMDGRVPETPMGRWAAEQMRQGDAAMIMEAGASIGRFDARPWLHEIDVPTAVVRTRFDRVVPPQRQSLLGTGIPNARTIDVDADHGACVMAADRFVPALVDAVTHVTGRLSPA